MFYDRLLGNRAFSFLSVRWLRHTYCQALAVAMSLCGLAMCVAVEQKDFNVRIHKFLLWHCCSILQVHNHNLVIFYKLL